MVHNINCEIPDQARFYLVINTNWCDYKIPLVQVILGWRWHSHLLVAGVTEELHGHHNISYNNRSVVVCFFKLSDMHTENDFNEVCLSTLSPHSLMSIHSSEIQLYLSIILNNGNLQ